MAEIFKKKMEELDQILSKNDFISSKLDLLQSKTGVPKNYIISGIVLILTFYLAFGWAAQLLCNIIAVAYPSYISIKAIESPDKRDDTKWLTYWAVYGSFTIVEYFSDLITKIIPFYWLIKCIFYIWCFAPIENNGSVIIYSRILRPYFLKHEKDADKLLDKAFGGAKQVIKETLKSQ